MEFEITKMGERGQVVIPRQFRDQMGLQKGEKFMVIEKGDMLVFKRLQAPSLQDFDRMLAKGHAHAKKHNLTKKDLEVAKVKARSKK